MKRSPLEKRKGSIAGKAISKAVVSKSFKIYLFCLVGLLIVSMSFGITHAQEGKQTAPSQPVESGAQKNTQEQVRLENIRAVTDKRDMIARLFSQDGNELVLTDNSSDGLYIFDIRRNKLKKLVDDVKAGVAPRYRFPKLDILSYITLQGNRITAFDVSYRGLKTEIEPQAYYPKLANGSAVFLLRGKLNLLTKDGYKEISPYGLRIFHFAVSAGKERVIMSANDGWLYQYSVTGDSIAPVVRGRIAAFMNDDKRFIYEDFEDDSSGKNVVSELAVYDFASDKHYLITNTVDRNETYPVISSDGYKLAFTAEGVIYTAEIVVYVPN